MSKLIILHLKTFYQNRLLLGFQIYLAMLLDGKSIYTKMERDSSPILFQNQLPLLLHLSYKGFHYEPYDLYKGQKLILYLFFHHYNIFINSTHLLIITSSENLAGISFWISSDMLFLNNESSIKFSKARAKARLSPSGIT